LDCPRYDENLKRCPCTWESCDKKGLCCLCIKYHLQRGELPACAFPPEVERTYDRSFERFSLTQRKG